jgi:hypothetical protein
MVNNRGISNIKNSTFKKLAQQYPITLIILFGSSAPGKTKKDSDVDIGVYLKDRIGIKEENNLIQDLVHLFKRSNIDTVILNSASPVLLFEVIKKGRLLFGKRRNDFLQFKLMVMKRYWEYAKFHKYREMYLNMKEKKLGFV